MLHFQFPTHFEIIAEQPVTLIIFYNDIVFKFYNILTFNLISRYVCVRTKYDKFYRSKFI